MLRVLTLSTLFPDATRPNFGIFVQRQTQELAARSDVELEVIAPLGLPPGPLKLHPRYRALSALPLQECWNGLIVHRPRFPLIPIIGQRYSAALLASALRPLVRKIGERFPFDMIDAQFFWPDGPAAARLAREFGVPFSIKARGADIHHWGKQPSCAKQIVDAGKAANGLLAVSAALKADMAALGLAEEAIRVHYTGVDLERFRPSDRQAAKSALGVAGPLLLSVGHLIERKGQGIAIDAMRTLPDATLLIVGEGPMRPALEARIAAAGLGRRVRLLGAIAHEALPELYGAADVMVLPAASEGLANVWVEALACGTPIVTTDVGGAREVVDRPAAGRLVPRGTDAIAAAVRDLLVAPPAHAEVRAAAERFTWKANGDALYEHLAGLR